MSTMTPRRRIEGSILLALLMAACGTAVFAAESRLPRAVDQARLGTAMTELVRQHIIPAGLTSDRVQSRAIVLPAGEAFISRLEYRFYRGVLYEQAMYYKRDRVPSGYAGLVQRLRQEYGAPAVEGARDLDEDRDVVWLEQAEWRDKDTRLTVADIHRRKAGRDHRELVLTITDLSLDAQRRQAEERQASPTEPSVLAPISDAVLPTRGPQEGRST